MVTFNPSGRLLVALFDLSQAGEVIDIFSLSETAGLNLYRTLAELESLEKRGLVDAGRLRLTLSGAAVAVSLDRRSRAKRDAGSPTASGGVFQLLPRATSEQPKRAEDQFFARGLVA
jgi:hypothetical protein